MINLHAILLEYIMPKTLKHLQQKVFTKAWKLTRVDNKMKKKIFRQVTILTKIYQTNYVFPNLYRITLSNLNLITLNQQRIIMYLIQTINSTLM